jgi:hypothetical protein
MVRHSEAFLGSTSFNFTQKFPLDGRLARYALAGAALLATSGTAKAGLIVYSGVVNLSVTPGTPLNVNFDGGSNEFSLNVSTGATKEIWLQGVGATRFNLGPLSFGAPITVGNTTASGFQDLFKAGYGVQPWDATTHGYIGVRFTTSAQQYLGWAELTLNHATPGAVLNSYAYDSTPNTQITAGEGAVPEPSSMALFAAGAAGLAILRRRRKHA